MDKVIDGLFISSWDTAQNVNLLKSNCIECIVDIGCNYVERAANIDYLSFSTVLDTPDTLILNVCATTDEWIGNNIKLNRKVLVHCVYGQSRSATVVVSYLLSTGMSIGDSIGLLTRVHPSVCINPGFLQQLCLLAVCTKASPEYRLLCCITPKVKSTTSPSSGNVITQHDIALDGGRYISCRGCGHVLSPHCDVITSPLDTSPFLAQYVDDFWRGYRRPISGSKGGGVDKVVIAVPLKGCLVVASQGWMQDALSRSGGRELTVDGDAMLRCPGCNAECGWWRSKALNLIGEHNLCDLYVLDKGTVKVKRPPPPPVETDTTSSCLQSCDVSSESKQPRIVDTTLPT